MLSVLGWLLEHWWLVLGIAAVAGAYIVGGWRLALAVASIGLASRVYTKGRRDGAAAIKRRDQERRENLKEKYDAIDNRPRDPADAFERLRDRARGE